MDKRSIVHRSLFGVFAGFRKRSKVVPPKTKTNIPAMAANWSCPVKWYMPHAALNAQRVRMNMIPALLRRFMFFSREKYS
jgi:hypothetical protein